MAKDNKKKVEQITDMEVDFAQWYTDVCKKAELIDYSSHQGHVYLPSLWLRHLGEYPDGCWTRSFKETGARERLPCPC